MADLGELQVKIAADVAGFERDIQGASSSVDQFGNSSQQAGERSARAMQRSERAAKLARRAKTALAAAAAAAAAAMVKMTVDGLKAADKQAKLARQIGMTNEELATLERATDLSGVSMGTLTRSTRRLDTELGNALGGAENARAKFEELGLSVEEISRMRPDERLQAIGDALGEMGTHAERTAAANELFGRSGQEMMLLLGNGSETLARASNEVDTFGLALNSLDSDRIESINDNISTLQSATRGASLQMAAGLSPVLAGITDMMVDWALENENVQNAVDTLASAATTAIGFIGDGIQDAMIFLSYFELGWRHLQVTALDVLSNINDAMFTHFRDFATRWQSLVDSLGILGGAVGGGAAGGLFRNLFSVDDADEFQANINRISTATRDRINDIETSIEQSQAGPKFSDLVEGWVADAESAGRKVRESSTATLEHLTDDLKELEGKGEESDDRRLEQLATFLMDEQQLIMYNHKRRIEMLEELAEDEKWIKEDLDNMKLALEEKTQEELTELARRGAQERVDLALNAGQNIARNASSIYSNLASSMESDEKKLFEIQKNARIADAIIDGIAAAVSSYRVGASIGGPVVGAAFAATSALATGAQIAAIRSQSFGGGGGQPSPPSAPSDPGGGQQQQMSTIMVQGLEPGQLITSDMARGMIDEINEQHKDGYRLVVG